MWLSLNYCKWSLISPLSGFALVFQPLCLKPIVFFFYNLISMHFLYKAIWLNFLFLNTKYYGRKSKLYIIHLSHFLCFLKLYNNNFKKWNEQNFNFENYWCRKIQIWLTFSETVGKIFKNQIWHFYDFKAVLLHCPELSLTGQFLNPKWFFRPKFL